MKAVMSLFKRRREIEREVEEELGFHIELLRRDHQQQGLAPEAANEAIARRFGDINKIKNECVAISSRSQPLVRVLKAVLLLLFCSGIVVRWSGSEINFRHLSNLLMAVSVLGYALLYARALTPANFVAPADDVRSLSILPRHADSSFASYDQNQQTPLERVISDD